MKNLSKIVLGACTLAAGSLFAEDNGSSWNPYVEIKGMAVKAGKKDGISYKWGWGGALETGLCYENWRVGVELGYIKMKTKNFTMEGFDFFTKCDGLSGMLNCYYDFSICANTNLYVGAGCGVCNIGSKMSSVNGNLQNYASHKTVFSYQIMTGISYGLSENWTVKVGYRMFKPGNNNDTVQVAGVPVNKWSKSPYTHCLELGLRYSF